MHDSVELGRALQRVLWSKSLDKGSFGWEFAVSYVLFLRAERSLASIRALVRLGFTDDAMALVRVMVEKSITAEYILLVGDKPALDFVQFLAFSEWRNYQELLSNSPDLVREYTPKQLKELEEAHDKAKARVMPDGSIRNRFGRGHDWTELNLAKRAEEVDRLLKENNYTATARTMYDGTYKKSASYLHSSFASIARSIETEAGGREVEDEHHAGMVKVNLGIRVRDKAPRLGLDALQMANTAAFQMLGFLAQVLKHRKSRQWAATYARKTLTRKQSRESKSA